jgi:exodeoxyribonuclease VII small subunit
VTGFFGGEAETEAEMSSPVNPSERSATFEASLARLQEIVGELDREGVELERAVALYEEGRKLVARCEKLLADAEKTLREAAAATTASAETAELGARADDEIPF